MRTARALEEEWRKVLRGSMSTGTKEDETSTGRIWAAAYHMWHPFSLGARFEAYDTFLYLIFKFFSGRDKPWILNQLVRWHECAKKETRSLSSSWSRKKHLKRKCCSAMTRLRCTQVCLPQGPSLVSADSFATCTGSLDLASHRISCENMTPMAGHCRTQWEQCYRAGNTGCC
jgi:hypothetical protein